VVPVARRLKVGRSMLVDLAKITVLEIGRGEVKLLLENYTTIEVLPPPEMAPKRDKRIRRVD
jgi:hypothetical protein